MVGDFRAALGAEFLCHFGEVIELHDLAKLLCKIWGQIGQTNPKRCRKSGDFSRIPPCEICENPYCREASVSWGSAKGMSSNVINLKRLLNGKQNVWKYQNGEEKSDSDGREKDV